MITISKFISESLTAYRYPTIESKSFAYLENKNFTEVVKNIMEQLRAKSKSDKYSVQKGNSSIVSAVENFIEEWINYVHFINYQEIKEYLAKHIELIDKLPIAIAIAKKHFPDSQIALEYYQDPEIDDKYIAIYIRLKDYDETFIDRLLKASDEVIKTLGIDSSRHILLDTDYEQIA